MTFILQRYSDNRDCTLGVLLKVLETAQGKRTVLQSYTLEDEYRDEKVTKETRIPAGVYELVIQTIETPKTLAYRTKYPWFQNHLMLKDVPGFIGIYIHVGNSDEDTDGCILLGDVAENNSIGEGRIANSTVAFRRFYLEVCDILQKKVKVTIEVRDEKTLMI